MMHKTELTVGQNVTGQALTVPVYQFTGNQPDAPTLYIQSSVHGAEVQGNLVCHYLLMAFQKLADEGALLGNITIVPYANPIGMNAKSVDYTSGRFDPVTGTNWNRQYHDFNGDYATLATAYKALSPEAIKASFCETLRTSLAEKIARPEGLTTGQGMVMRLQQMAIEADLVLDLHTGPRSARHLYAAAYAEDSARALHIDDIIIMPNGFDGALDEACFVPWWSLSLALADEGITFDHGIEAFTVELGSQEQIDSDDAAEHCEGILNWLMLKGVVAADCQNPTDRAPNNGPKYGVPLEDYITLYAPVGGLAEYLVAPGQTFQKGDCLARILKAENIGTDQAFHAVIAPADGRLILHFDSASLYQGAELCKFTKIA